MTSDPHQRPTPEGTDPAMNERDSASNREERRPGVSGRPSPGTILTALQIGTPLDEFRHHFEKKQRSFDGAGEGRARDIYRRAYELAEALIQKGGGGGASC